MNIEARIYIDRGDFTLNVEFSIARNGVTAVFGPSGSGKTTLLRALAGLENSTKSYLKVGNQIWQDEETFVPTHKRSIGYVFQEASLFPHLNVIRNIDYGLKRSKTSVSKDALHNAIDLLGIDQLLDRRPSQLSGGEQQRVAIARALAPAPSMLLLDEPLASLDLQRKKEVLPYLESIHQELDIPVIYVTHSRDEVARLADHLLLIDKGHLKASGPVNELFSNLDIYLAHDAQAETVIEATVVKYDALYGLSKLAFSGGHFTVATKPLSLGSTVRLQVLARDVSITLNRQAETSILNIFPVTVNQLYRENDSQMTIRLMVGDVPLLSRITRKSADELRLREGDGVFAQIKSVALLT